MTDHFVLFMPSGKRGYFATGTPILDAARHLGVYIESVCGGRGICGRCQIDTQFGKFAKHGITSAVEHISKLDAIELRYHEKRHLEDGRRLSCSARIMGDLVIDIPQNNIINAQVIRKDADTRLIERNPAIQMCYVEVEEPDMHKPLGDIDRLRVAIENDWNIKNLQIDTHILMQAQSILRQGKWAVTAAIHLDKETNNPHLCALYPGLKNEAYGIACDIGSTTIALHLSSLLSGSTIASAGTSNPQIRFGEDLMSRVSYVMMNPEGREAMTRAVCHALNQLISEVCQQGRIDRHDILDSVFVGNPIMHHLLLGIDPTELGGAPFALAVSSDVTVKAKEIGIELNEGARTYILPCIAGHVGADAAAATLSEGPHRQDQEMLMIDVGTNAEIVLGNKEYLVAASSPTGPAFEGAETSCGQRAAPGAIERIRIDHETLEPRYRVIGSLLFSDEEGFEEEIKQTGITGICGSGIIEAIAEMYLAGIITQDGVINGEMREKSNRVFSDGRTFSYLIKEGEPKIVVTQSDVRAIQLAKAALYAGIKLLMDKKNISSVDKIVLAGAFGSFIDPKYAMVLGLIPDCDIAYVNAVGNAAGTGARMALLNRNHRREIERTVHKIQKIETALEPDFQTHFVNAMAFPNKVDPFPKLAAIVKLPEQQRANQTGEKRASRRGRRRRG